MKVIQRVHELVDADYWDWGIIKWMEGWLRQFRDVSKELEHLVVIPGAFQADKVDEINELLSEHPYCVVMVTSDEEAKFPVEQLDHPRMKVWLQYHRNQWVHRYLPIGPGPGRFRPADKTLDWCFSGQVGHTKRQELMEVMREVGGGFLFGTPGFTQGLPREDYEHLLSYTRMALCPGGPNSPDSFRLYEALESGCIPIVDNAPFFEEMFGDFPFLTVSHWDEAPDLIENYRASPDAAKTVYDWWQKTKYQLAYALEEDLCSLR